MSVTVKTQGGGGGMYASIFVNGLSKTDIVTASNGKKTKNGVWAARPNPLYEDLPSAYTPLEYIKSTGSQHFDTRFIPTYRTRLVVEVSAVTSGAGTLFGTRNDGVAGASDSFGLIRQSNGTFRSDYFGSQVILEVADASAKTTIDKNRNVVSAYGKVATNTAVTSGTSKKSLYLFAMHDSDGSAQMLGRFCAGVWQIVDNDILVRNYIPVKRKSDGAVGLYDTVEKFFGQSSSGTPFEAGPEASPYIYGHEIAKIKDIGMWTVAATNGVKTKTKDVFVNAAVEYEIEIDLLRLWLYREGDQCEEVTGGWYKNNGVSTASYPSASGTVTFEESALYVSAGSGVSAAATTGNKISIDGETKIFATFADVNKDLSIRLTEHNTGDISTDKCVAHLRTEANGTVELDISGNTGECYFTFIAASTRSGRLTQLWLE